MKKETKVQVKPNPALIAAFDDLISEKDVIEKMGYSTETLRQWRVDGKIKNWYSVNGRKFMYSKTELAQLLQVQATKIAS